MDTCDSGSLKARKLVEACNEIITSDKLARVLQKMLAVGNVMNQGTFRGNATGFTVDSLLRMIKMKGADKKTTVLDYVVKSLFDRGEERVLVVAEDLGVLEGVSKISGSEIGRQLGEVETTFESLKSELDDAKAIVAPTSPVPSPASGGGGAVESNGESSHEMFIKRLGAHVREFENKVEEVKKCRRLMQRKVTEVVEYFGEDPATCDTGRIFDVLQEFRKALTSSKEAVIRRERSLARSNGGNLQQQQQQQQQAGGDSKGATKAPSGDGPLPRRSGHGRRESV